MHRPDAVELAARFVDQWPSGPTFDEWIAALLMLEEARAWSTWARLVEMDASPSIDDFIREYRSDRVVVLQ